MADESRRDIGRKGVLTARAGTKSLVREQQQKQTLKAESRKRQQQPNERWQWSAVLFRIERLLAGARRAATRAPVLKVVPCGHFALQVQYFSMRTPTRPPARRRGRHAGGPVVISIAKQRCFFAGATGRPAARWY